MPVAGVAPVAAADGRSMRLAVLACSSTDHPVPGPVPDRLRSSCSCTSSATTGSRGATACGSRCSRSASGPSCSAATTGRHALEVQRRPARRLRQDAGRRRRGQRHRRRRGRARTRTASPARRVAAAGDRRAAGPVANFMFAIVVLAILFAAVGRPFTPPRSDGAAGQPGGHRRAPAGRQDHRGRRPADRELRGAPGRRARSAGTPLSLRSSARASARPHGHADDRGTPIGSARSSRWGWIGVSRAGVEFGAVDPLRRRSRRRRETGSMICGTLLRARQMVDGPAQHPGTRRPAADRADVGRDRQDGFVPAIWFTAVLSINLGLINLFPIPMLDGGHLAAVRDRGGAGPAAQRAQPGDRLPVRAGHGVEPDGVRHLERRRAFEMIEALGLIS